MQIKNTAGGTQP